APINDLSRGASVSDIVNVALITCLQALTPATGAEELAKTTTQTFTTKRRKEGAMTKSIENPAQHVASAPSGAGDGGAPERMAKTLKPRWVFAIALGSAVGWGAFILPTDWLATGGPLGTLVGFAIGAGLMLVIAVSYGFLIRTFPVSG